MDRVRLVRALAPLVTPSLAEGLIDLFIQIRLDFSTKTLGRAAPGKFVETYVQCLQYLSEGTYQARPEVDHYLATKAEADVKISESLRICGARIARSIYTLRNKRSIAHVGQIDPNTADLAFIHQGAAWIMAELLRSASGLSMEEAGTLVALVQAPVSTIVEEIGDTRLVLPDVGVRTELLLLLHSHYPEPLPVAAAIRSLSRRNPGT